MAPTVITNPEATLTKDHIARSLEPTLDKISTDDVIMPIIIVQQMVRCLKRPETADYHFVLIIRASVFA
jgi:hypothetical protein